jgi:hypothetical protein
LPTENSMATNTEQRALDETSPSVQAHLSIIQNVIQRMGTNSASCKTWCITIVAAILVVIADKGRPQFVWLAVLPIITFASLDVYYLHLEKGFRTSYNDFIRKIHHHSVKPSDLYTLDPTGSTRDLVGAALKSYSIAGFYAPLLLLALATFFMIEPDRTTASGQAQQVPSSRYQHYR